MHAGGAVALALALRSEPVAGQRAHPFLGTGPHSVIRLEAPPRRDAARREGDAIWVTRKRWGFAIPGMMAGNVLPMIYNEFIQPWKEISRTGPHTWSLYWNPFRQWEWDDNHFINNQVVHPVQGNFYFNAARSNGFGYYWSTAFALVGSYLWECCSERRKGSYNDWANTTLGGAALGEMLYRASSMVIDQDARGLDRIGLELLVLPLNAARFASRGIYGEWDDRGNPPGRLPDQMGLSLASGLRQTTGRPHPFLDVELRYGSLYGSGHDSPFDRFSVNAQINGRDETIGLVQVEGHLLNRRLWGTPIEQNPNGWIVKWLVLQNYDYLDSAPHGDDVPLEEEHGYRYGGQSLGLGLATIFPAWNARVEAQAQLDAIPVGGVNSIHAAYSGDIPERSREYDFGIGFGYRAKMRVSFPTWVRAWGSLAGMYLYTLNGSNVCDANGCSESKHRVLAATGGIKVELERIFKAITGVPEPWAEDFWIGGDYLWFKKESRYWLPDRPGENYTSHQWRAMISWDLGP